MQLFRIIISYSAPTFACRFLCIFKEDQETTYSFFVHNNFTSIEVIILTIDLLRAHTQIFYISYILNILQLQFTMYCYIHNTLLLPFFGAYLAYPGYFYV